MSVLHHVCRFWFASMLIVAVILMWLHGHAVYLLLASKPLLDKQQRCKSFVRSMFRLVLALCPWISFDYNDPRGQWKDFERVPNAAFVIINHTSFMDAIAYTALCAADVLPNCCTLAKKELFNLPLFGTCMKQCGHLPVPFTAKDDGNFSVDRTEMDKTMQLAGMLLLLLWLTTGCIRIVNPNGHCIVIALHIVLYFIYQMSM
jgi:1-acyl-sn-glycerol-3-phosphate acyltransferase